MLKKYVSQPSFFSASYFQEAPGDETDSVQVTVAPRQNRGTDYGDDTNTVTVGPRANRGADYTQDDEQPDQDEPAEEETPAPAEDNAPDDNPPAEPDTSGDDATDYGADGDAEGDEDTGGGDAPADDTGDEGEDAPDAPDTGDDTATDYTDDGDAEGGDTGDDTGGDTDDGTEMTEEERAEAEKKYHMYKRFVHLYNMIESFIERCRNVVKPDAIQNSVIKTVTNNLSELSDNMFDFMTIKYKTSSYVKIHLYFETVISVVQLNFELLKNNKINLKQ